MLARRLLIAAILAFGLSGPALAQDEEGPTLDQCAADFDSCMESCSEANADSSAGLAGCQARCAANRAACEAQAGYEEAKPWVQEQFERMEEFFNGFRDGPGDTPPTEDELKGVDEGEGKAI